MIQFALPNNAGILDLYPNTRIKIRFNNPAFDSKLQTGSYTLPFSLPATANNMEKLYYINLATSRGQIQKKYECLLYIAGLYFASGILYVNSYACDAQGAYSFSCDFSLDTGIFSNKLGDLTLPQLPHNTYDFARTTLYPFVYRAFFVPGPTNEFDSAYDDMIMTLVSISTLGGTPFVYSNTIDTRYSETKVETEVLRKAEWLNIFANKINKFNEENYTNPVPIAYARSAGYNFCLEGSTLADPYYFAVRVTYITEGSTTAPEIYYQIFDTDIEILDFGFEEDDFVFPQVQNGSFYDSSNPVDFRNFKFRNEVFAGFVNKPIGVGAGYALSQNVLEGSFSYDEDYARLYASSFYNVVPFPKIGYIFSKIAEYTGYSFFGDFLDNEFLMKLVVYNTYAIDELQNLTGRNWYSATIDLANHVPNRTVKEFMVELSKLFNFYYTFDFRQNKCTMVFRKSLLLADIIDITDKVLTEFESQVVEPKNKRLKYDSGLDVDGFADFFASYLAGNYEQTEEETFGAGTLPNIYLYVDMPSVNEAYTTTDNIVGNSNLEVFNVGKNNGYPIRFLFWRGERGQGKYYIPNYAGADALVAYGDNYSLEWQGNRGLGYQWHKEWIDFVQNSRVMKRKVWFNIKDLFSIDLNKRYAINYQLHLIKSIEIEVSNGAETIKSPAVVEFAQFLK